MNSKYNYSQFLNSDKIVKQYLALFRTMTHEELKDFFKYGADER